MIKEKFQELLRSRRERGNETSQNDTFLRDLIKEVDEPMIDWEIESGDVVTTIKTENVSEDDEDQISPSEFVTTKLEQNFNVTNFKPVDKKVVKFTKFADIVNKRPSASQPPPTRRIELNRSVHLRTQLTKLVSPPSKSLSHQISQVTAIPAGPSTSAQLNPCEKCGMLFKEGE